MDKSFLPDQETEKSRYLLHENDITNVNYQEFVSPITNSIIIDFKSHHKGLDFGAGTGPVISKILTDNGYSIGQYDPFFHNNKELLDKKYDYIACCEVIEHFHFPNKEFTLLNRILNKGGKLYCMTESFSASMDFEKWYYKNDPTHVFFYQERTFQFIKQNFGFNELTMKGRLTMLAK